MIVLSSAPRHFTNRSEAGCVVVDKRRVARKATLSYSLALYPTGTFMSSISPLRRAGIALAATTALVTGAMALTSAPASAAGGFFGLIPKSHPTEDVAAVHGLIPDFGLNKRDNSGLSFAEQWIEVEGVGVDGIHAVFLQSRALGPGGLSYCMDSQAPLQVVPKKFDPIGTRPCDFTTSQIWNKEPQSGGRVAYHNALSNFYLTYKLVGSFPAYDQRSFSADSVFSKKTPS
ncbi:hypothetical protein ABZS94_34750 [Streptomyces sp. NPDC005500]|uniref:hypothetical protein n=1 Tax=Streptomyces sp. NPDC005500 TaxID=3155007 RepID=UPI0033AF636D